MESNEEQEEEIITIGTLINQREIAFVKSVFEDRGIWCFVADEHTTTILPHYSLAMGEARIQVRKSDEKSARELLEEIRENDKASVEETWKDDEEELEYFKEQEEDSKSARRSNAVGCLVALGIILLAIWFGVNT